MQKSFWIWIASGALLFSSSLAASAQKLPSPQRVWSVGPLTKPQTVGSFSIGPNGMTMGNLHLDSQTGSVFSATRSVVFVGERIVLASKTGMRVVNGTQPTYELLSLDAGTGEVRSRRDISDVGFRALFATNDAHVIVCGGSVMRLTQDLKDDGSFDYHASGHKFGEIQNISPDGSTLGNATSPGFELVDARTLKPQELTTNPAVATSVSAKGFVTDNVHWIRDYPRDLSFVTYTDSAGQHLLYHGSCGGRPQFLTDDLILEPGCKGPIIIDTRGNLVRTIGLGGPFSYAGVSQDGKRFVLQLPSFNKEGSLKQEIFVVYSVGTGEAVAEVRPKEKGEQQSWTALSPDGSMIVIGSPLKLSLYRLP